MNIGASRTEAMVPVSAPRLIRYLLWPGNQYGVKIRLVVALLLSIGAKMTIVAAPFFYKQIIDTLSTPAIAIPIGLILGYAAARLFSELTDDVRRLIFTPVAQRAIRIITLDAFRNLQAQSVQYHVNIKTGGLISIIARGATAIEFLIDLCVFNIFPILLELLLIAIVLFGLYDPAFAMVTAVTCSVYLVFTVLCTHWQLRFRTRMNSLDVAASMLTVDSLLNIETVKNFGAEQFESERYERARRDYEKAAIKNSVTELASNAARALIISVGGLIMTILAAVKVVAGDMTAGDFVLVNTYLIQLYAPLGALGGVYTQVKQSLTDAEAMFGLLARQPDMMEKPNAPAMLVSNAHVAFDHVSFRYDTRRPILNDVSFTIPPGKTVAIVGPTGAGKSTIGRLLLRHYDVDAGEITIDDQSIRDVTQVSLRKAIGVVPQDTTLFDDTIRANIAYGLPDATDEAVRAAAAIANLHEFVECLPDGYNTMVGERGLKMSGGEKQRIAIARIVLKNVKLLIFDEATSALDTATERAILENLKDVSRQRTTLVIAHRLSTVVDADEILVLSKGEIAERGAHQDLLDKNGIYSALWKKQSVQKS